MSNRVLVDLAPLRESRDFRLLFAGQTANMFGSQLTRVAVPFQVFALTHSSLQVGAVSLAQLVPLVVGALAGGSVADAVDRRRVLVASSAALACTSGALAANAALARPSLVAVYLASAVAAGCGGVLSTACNAAVPALVGPRRLLAAYASMQIVDQAAMVLGPALSGLLIAAVRLPWVYAVDAATCVLMAAAMVPMSARPPGGGGRRPGVGSVVEGLRYVARRQVLQGAFVVDVNAMVFGLPRAVFPALAVSVFHGGPSVLGYLYAAPGAGALLGAVATGWLERVRRQGRAVVVAVCAWGAAVAAFGLVHVLWAALVLLGVAGWADVVSAVLRTTIVQRAVPDAFRSRMSAMQIAVVEGGPRLGDLESGAVAAATSAGFSVVSGGIACVAGALAVAGLLPRFRRYGRDVSASHAASASPGPSSP